MDNHFMKLKFVFLFLLGVSACGFQLVESRQLKENPPAQILNPNSKQTVLVELFTSEGCSSCPPADRALAFLQKEQPNSAAEIITLAFHVDYWNNLGWKDEFSSPLFTQRQQFYARKFRLDSAYTPQMVIDGSYEFIGSNLGKAQKSISEVAKLAKAKIKLEKNEADLKVKISDIPPNNEATVYLAIAEDNLVSDVKRGENSGNKLEHISVVRELKILGKLAPNSQSFEIEQLIKLDERWKKENLKLVVFIQENKNRQILGSQFLPILNDTN